MSTSMTDAQPNDVQVKQRSKMATTVAKEQIQDIVVLSNDAVVSGAWSWPIKVCMLVVVLPTSFKCRLFLTVQFAGTVISFVSPFTPESHQATHNQVDRSHFRGHCRSVRRWLSPNCGSSGFLEWAAGLCNCCTGHLRCWFCHRTLLIQYHLAIDRAAGFIR